MRPKILSILLLLLVCASVARAQRQVSSISPDHVIAGSGSITLTVTGANFNGFEDVIFNGNSYSVSFVSSRVITATIPNTQFQAIASYSVYINLVPSTVFRFRVLSPLASLSEYAPTQFPSAVNTPVIVYGREFPSNATILFDFQPITTTFVSPAELTGTVPGSLISSSPNKTHHILVYNGPFTAASIGTLQSTNIITSDPQIALSNIPIGTSLTGTGVVTALQGTVTLGSPYYTISGPNAGDFSNTGGSCANGKVLAPGGSCPIQITATPTAFPSPPAAWQPTNSYALNSVIVDNANKVPNATPHLQKVTTNGTSGALAAAPGNGLQKGVIVTSALDDAGTGYAVNDTFTVNGGTASATGQVNSIGGGGTVTGITIYAAGVGYSLGTHIATTATSGVGTGMTVDITAVAAGPWNESGGTTVDGSVTWTDQGPYVLVVSESATLTVNSNAANNPQTIPLSLTKTLTFNGAAGLLIGNAAINPAGYSFGTVVQSVPTSRNFILQNQGGGWMTLATPFYALTGANAADFAVSGVTCSNGLFLNGGGGIATSPGQSCTFTGTFTPSGTSAETATLTINWTSIGGSSGSAVYILTGTGKTAGTKIALAWTASTSSSLTGYNVYRGTQSGGPYTLLTNLGLVTSYNDTTPVHGNTYCYVVTAKSTTPPYGIPESGNSNEACATF